MNFPVTILKLIEDILTDIENVKFKLNIVNYSNTRKQVGIQVHTMQW